MAKGLVRCYKLYSTSVGNGEATLQIGGSGGRIIGVSFTGAGVAVAGVVCSETHELCINTSTSQLTVNDSVTSVAAVTLGTNIASSTAFANLSVPGLGIPVSGGDRMVLNGAALGGCASLATRAIECYIYVQE